MPVERFLRVEAGIILQNQKNALLAKRKGF